MVGLADNPRRFRSASLRPHVVVVVLGRADEEMLWIAAGAHVASVADTETRRHRRNEDAIGDDVSGARNVVNRDLTVARTGADAPLPDPAAVAIDDDAGADALPQSLGLA
jgi:hypothetical protein